jgi:hypothetical protein
MTETTCPHNGAMYDACCNAARVSRPHLLLRNVFFMCAPLVCTTFKTFACWWLGKPKRVA